MKVMVAPRSHYETAENFSAKIMKVMVASKSCRVVIASIRFLFLVKTYFERVLGEACQMMLVYLLRG